MVESNQFFKNILNVPMIRSRYSKLNLHLHLKNPVYFSVAAIIEDSFFDLKNVFD